jgi:hypothetical protein
VAVDVVTEDVNNRPCAEVAAYAADPTHAPEWYGNIESVKWRTEPPVQVGSRMDFVARFLSRRLAYTYEVVELVPGERLVMRTAQGPFPMETTYTWQAVDPGHTPDEAAQPWRAGRLRQGRRAGDDRRHAPRQQQGPGHHQARPGGPLRASPTSTSPGR